MRGNGNLVGRREVGFIVRAGKGVRIDPKKVEAIRAWETPKTVSLLLI
jgi:hypothetical protein